MFDLIKYWNHQVAFPERVTVKNKEQMFSLLNKVNKIKNKIYFSLYDCDDNGKFSKPHIDKIALDLDSFKSFENIKASHYKLMKMNRKHLMIFSTGGFWLYEFTKNYDNLKYPNSALLNAIESVLKELNLTMGNEKVCDTDHHCVDIARVARFPNSFDKKRGIYCIPITEEDLEKGFDWIKEKAKKPCYEFIYYGEELIDMIPFDSERKKVYNVEMPEWDVDDSTFKNISDNIISDFPPCMKRILLEDNIDTYDNRYLFALYCHEIGLPAAICNKIAKKYFSRTERTDGLGTNYDHFVKFKVLEYAYGRDDFFPTCDSLFRKGLCKGKCPKYNKAVYK